MWWLATILDSVRYKCFTVTKFYWVTVSYWAYHNPIDSGSAILANFPIKINSSTKNIYVQKNNLQCPCRKALENTELANNRGKVIYSMVHSLEGICTVSWGSIMYEQNYIFYSFNDPWQWDQYNANLKKLRIKNSIKVT